jgi:hypothetical protein
VNAQEDRDAAPDLPHGLEPPVWVEESTEVIPLWSGDARLVQSQRTQSGAASITIDTLPQPVIRFSFESADPNGSNVQTMLRALFVKD